MQQLLQTLTPLLEGLRAKLAPPKAPRASFCSLGSEMIVFVTRVLHHMTIIVHLRSTEQTPRGTILVYLHGVTFICALFDRGEKARRAFGMKAMRGYTIGRL